MDNLQFLGRLHPLVVHFPVAILLAAAVLTLLARRDDFASLHPMLPTIWAAGAVSALFACATGWFLKNENLGETALTAHRNWGIAAAVGAMAAALFFQKKSVSESGAAVVARLVLLSILPTLHFGTSMTHGSNYFFQKKSAFAEVPPEAKGLSPAADLPTENLPPAARAEDLAAARRAGLAVLEVAAGSPFLSVSAVNFPQFSDSSAVVLERLAGQIVWLKLSGAAQVGDSTCLILSKLTQLSRLHLDGTQVGDAGIFHLKNLKNLRLLNLNGTAATARGVAVLSDLPRLERLFLFKTPAAADFQLLKNSFPKASIDTGGYFVPTFDSDTTLLLKN